MPEDVKKIIRDFIVANFLFGDDDGLEDETSFLDEGIIDSTGILELIEFIEKQFKVEVKETEMVPENLDSLTFVTNFVSSKATIKE